MEKFDGGIPELSEQQIIKIGDLFAVTLDGKMLDQLQFIVGETVEVETRETELIIRKLPAGGGSGLVSSELIPPIQETHPDYPLMTDREGL